MEIEGKTFLINLSLSIKFPINSPDYLKGSLLQIVKYVGLTPFENTLIIQPFLVKGSKSDISYTGTLVLGESHFCFHIFPENNFIRLELSSCKSINEDKLKQALELFFSPDKIDIESVPWIKS